MDGSSGRFSIRSWESESPAFGLFVAVVAVFVVAAGDVVLLRDEVPKKSTSASRSAVAEPRLEPGGLSFVDPLPWLEVLLLVRRERARRRRPKSVGVVVAVAVDADVVVVVGSTSATAAACAAAPPPSMTSATVVARLLERTASAQSKNGELEEEENGPSREGEGRSFLSPLKRTGGKKKCAEESTRAKTLLFLLLLLEREPSTLSLCLSLAEGEWRRGHATSPGAAPLRLFAAPVLLR